MVDRGGNRIEVNWCPKGRYDPSAECTNLLGLSTLLATLWKFAEVGSRTKVDHLVLREGC